MTERQVRRHDHALPFIGRADHVKEQLGALISLIVDGGPSPRSVASTIVDLTDDAGYWRILREGAIPNAEIAEVLGS